jgi:hypothetical protein
MFIWVSEKIATHERNDLRVRDPNERHRCGMSGMHVDHIWSASTQKVGQPAPSKKVSACGSVAANGEDVDPYAARFQ